MQPARRAVIDVGTNSVKLLVADVEASKATPRLERSEQTRLGRGFYETHRLQADAIAHTAEAVGGFARLASEEGAKSVRVIATSAARDAVNKDELIAALVEAAHVPIEVISGEQEADWVFRGVTSDSALVGNKLLIVDVGGGSTELILGEGEHYSLRHSFDLGSVRLLEKLRPLDPPGLDDLAACRQWLKDFFNQHINPRLESLKAGPAHREIRLVGTGGTTTLLARMQKRLETFDRGQIEGSEISRPQILEWMRKLWSMPLSERRQIVGLPPSRADIILMGVAIYEAVMEHFDFQHVYVSTRGLRFGAIIDQA